MAGNKLEPQVFAAAIKRLSDYFIKFELTKEQMEAWYKFFAKYSESDLFHMFQLYIENNEFPPQSPKSILKTYEEKYREHLKQKYMTAEEAWEIVRSGVRMYSLHHEHYMGEQFYAYLRQYTALVADAAKQHEKSLAGLNESNVFTVMSAYKRTYNELLEKRVEEQVVQRLQLTTVEKLMLGSGE